MGNSAMKCFPCSRGTVTVGLLNGDLAKFKEPVRASTVMKRYPQHVVLHCSMASNLRTGQRRRISVLKPDQPLKSNQNYLITPIQTAGNSKPFLDSWAFFTLSVNRKLNDKLRYKTKRSYPRRSWIQTLLDKFFRSSRSYHSLDDDDQDYTRPLFDRNQPSIVSRRSLGSVRDKRPSMECIPESPTLSRNSSFNSYPRLDFG